MIEVRRAGEADLGWISALERESFSAPWTEAQLGRLCRGEGGALFAAFLDGAPAGYAGLETVLDEADMMNLAVAPRHRRQGIARQLVEALGNALRAQGVQSLTLEVRASNEAAIQLYRSLGFTQVGRRPRYYTKPTEDALILRWTLHPS